MKPSILWLAPETARTRARQEEKKKRKNWQVRMPRVFSHHPPPEQYVEARSRCQSSPDILEWVTSPVFQDRSWAFAGEFGLDDRWGEITPFPRTSHWIDLQTSTCKYVCVHMNEWASVCHPLSFCRQSLQQSRFLIDSGVLALSIVSAGCLTISCT